MSSEPPGEGAGQPPRTGSSFINRIVALSLAQRALSTPVRRARREQRTTAGTEPLEHALRLLTWASVALAVGLVAARLR